MPMGAGSDRNLVQEPVFVFHVRFRWVHQVWLQGVGLPARLQKLSLDSARL